MATFQKSSSRLARTVIPALRNSLPSKGIRFSPTRAQAIISGQRNAIATPTNMGNTMCYTTFSGSSSLFKGITPDSSDPTPPSSAPFSDSAIKPVEMSREEFATFANSYMEDLGDRLEQLAETKDTLEVDTAAGFVGVDLKGRGTYSINMHSASKQIWWSSPISGPKRFDYVVLGDSMGEKADLAEGAWVFTKDGTRLEDLVLKEFGVDMTIGVEN